MGSYLGKCLHVSIFGQSHSQALGCVVDGLPAGFPVDFDALNAFMQRRAPGQSSLSTPRKEADIPQFVSGLVDGHTCGAPLCALIENTNVRSQDYEPLRSVPRPGHADLSARTKYRNFHDVAGGGHFSGRLTAALCVAGGIALQILETQGINIVAHIQKIGCVSDEPLNQLEYDAHQVERIRNNAVLPCLSSQATEQMAATILQAREAKDSVGGVIECAVYGAPAGLGEPWFDGIENVFAQALFGVPAVKGVEFGSGFAGSQLFGSQNNDEYGYCNGKVQPLSNHAGGILGGISTGLPIYFSVAIKPTPSIAAPQQSVNLDTGEDEVLKVQGRHDPCIVPRAVPVIEAVSALVTLDLILSQPTELRW